LIVLTLQEFSASCWHFLIDLADWWVQVIDTQNLPLFEVKRGSLFIFENETLPRLGWNKFKAKALDDKLNFLARGVVVLTVENEDMFLVRLPNAQ